MKSSLLVPLVLAGCAGPIQQLVNGAVKDQTVTLPEGTFDECLVIEGEGVHLEGAGMGKTIVRCPTMPLKITGSSARVKGITFVKTSGEKTVGAIQINKYSVLSECEVTTAEGVDATTTSGISFFSG